MQVFRAYFKVMRASASGIAIYLIVFLALAVVFSISGAPEASGEFVETRTPIAVINRDPGAPLAQGLVDYLAETHKVMAYADEPEKLQDALFFRNVEYVAIIPEGFSADFVAGRDRQIQTIVVPNSISSHYMDMRVDKYLNAARLHRDYGKERSQEQLVAGVRSDLALEVPVTVESYSHTNGYIQGFVYYYRYYAYVALAMIIIGVGSIMMAFNQPDLRLRNRCAPIPLRSMKLQLAAGHTVFALSCWVLLVLLSLVLYGRNLFSSGLIWLYSLNTLAFTVVSASIAFLVGGSAKSHSGLSGAMNVVVLGMSFISGVFVPQEILSKPVLAFARFLPAYWYVKANDAIGALSQLTGKALRSIYSDILIQVGFAVAIFAMTLLLSKEKQAARDQ